MARKKIFQLKALVAEVPLKRTTNQVIARATAIPPNVMAKIPAPETGPKLGLFVFDRDGKAIIGAVAPGSKAAANGVRPGTVIIAVAGKKTTSSAEVATAIDAARQHGDKTLLMWLETKQGKRFVAFDLGAA